MTRGWCIGTPGYRDDREVRPQALRTTWSAGIGDRRHLAQELCPLTALVAIGLAAPIHSDDCLLRNSTASSFASQLVDSPSVMMFNASWLIWKGCGAIEANVEPRTSRSVASIQATSCRWSRCG